MAVWRLTQAVLASLTLVSWLLAHSLAYSIVAPEDGGHAHLLKGTGHGYLESVAPLLVAGCVALVVVGFAAAVVAGLRDHERPDASLAVLAAVPPVGFVVQEHLERLVETGSFPAGAVLEPTLAIGLLIQAPLLACALLLGRWLLATARRLGRYLRARRWPLLRPAPPAARPCTLAPIIAVPSGPPVARHAPRSPPRLLLAG